MLAVVPGEITPVTVTQQRTRNDDEDLFQASYAVDKNLSTRAFAEDVNGEVWLKLEFDRTYFIHQITIYQYFYTNWYDPDNWCVQSESNYHTCKDTQNHVDLAVYQGDELQATCGTLELTGGLEQTDQIYTFICSAEGDTVLLSKTDGAISVYEIVVTGRGMYLT